MEHCLHCMKESRSLVLVRSSFRPWIELRFGISLTRAPSFGPPVPNPEAQPASCFLETSVRKGNAKKAKQGKESRVVRGGQIEARSKVRAEQLELLLNGTEIESTHSLSRAHAHEYTDAFRAHLQRDSRLVTPDFNFLVGKTRETNESERKFRNTKRGGGGEARELLKVAYRKSNQLAQCCSCQWK